MRWRILTASVWAALFIPAPGTDGSIERLVYCLLHIVGMYVVFYSLVTAIRSK